MSKLQSQRHLTIDGKTRAIIITNVAHVKGFERQQALAAIKQVEKKVFPAAEAMDFDLELAKNNTQLLFISLPEARPSSILGYLLNSRTGRQASLHKLCILPAQRRQGMAKMLLGTVQKDLSRKGCSHIQLWVDESREPARRLYKDSGFVERQFVEDYYGPGRSGIKMTCDLDQMPHQET